MIIDYFAIGFMIFLLNVFVILFGYLQFSDKKDVLNNILAFGALFFVYIHISLFLLLMFQDQSLHDTVLPIWMIALILPPLVMGILVFICTMINKSYKFVKKSPKDFSRFEARMINSVNTMKASKRDTFRKLSHVLIFIGMIIFWTIAYNFVKGSGKRWAGMIPTDGNTLGLYLRLFSEPNSVKNVMFTLGWFYFSIFFFFYIFNLFMLTNELTRKTNKVSFFFNLFPKLIMTEEEKSSYGTYLFFSIGQLFAAFLCPPMVYFAILGMSGLGDLMTSQIGIRFGKHHITWNEKKTWEGNIAGTITSFLICFPFVGLVWSIIFTIAFMLFDLFTNRPFNMSDNLLIPIGCALIFVTLRFWLEIPHVSWIVILYP